MIRARKMKLAGVVHDTLPESDPDIDRDAERSVRAHLARLGLDCPFIRIPAFDGTDYPGVDFSEIYR